MAVQISNVIAGSPADKRGVRAGDTLLSINGNTIEDVLDYQFYAAETSPVLMLKTKEGRFRGMKILKPEYDDLGLEFDSYLMDQQRHCKNKCIFCFIDQLPKGMRETLYFKDDDSRLSFLFGNYVTLTNLTEHDVQRIIKMHISPVNISVHTTNPELRVQMMKNPNAGPSLEIVSRLANAGIKINTQLVLCAGINDGEELKRTLNDLGRLYPSVQMVAAVPLGVTKYREGLPQLELYNKETAGAVLDILEAFGESFLEKHGTRFAFAADEFYLKAERPMPPASFYEDFEQLENGVGLCALLEDEFLTALEAFEGTRKERKITMATGVAAYSLLQKLTDCFLKKAPHFEVAVVPIMNDFFGETITVSGLVVGQDMIRQLEGKELGEELLFPASMLRREGDIFLDDTSVDTLAKTLSVKATPVPNDGAALLSAILG